MTLKLKLVFIPVLGSVAIVVNGCFKHLYFSISSIVAGSFGSFHIWDTLTDTNTEVKLTPADELVSEWSFVLSDEKLFLMVS